MGDVGEDYKAMKIAKQERHRKWHAENRAIIDKHDVQYSDKGEALIFREKGKKPVDFYPSTGRWKSYEHGNDGWKGRGRLYNGGAIKFIRWYLS